MLAIYALALVTAAAAQTSDCELSTLFDGETLEKLIVDAVLGGDSPQASVATVLRNHTVCLSVGNRRGTFRSISVLVDYTCVGSGLCPSRATEQFDFGCNYGRWTASQLTIHDYIRDSNPLATFDTDLRTDCVLCFRERPETVEEFDNVTHCQGNFC